MNPFTDKDDIVTIYSWNILFWTKYVTELAIGDCWSLMHFSDRDFIGEWACWFVSLFVCWL